MYKRTNLTFWLAIFVFFTAFKPCEITSGKIIYVDEIAVGANDGSNWDNAYNFLQDALTDANESEKPVEIRLAQGSYSPDQYKLNPEGTADREATFQLINGVSLKGGYAGLGVIDPNTRDEVLFETILVGDIRSTGFGGGNSYHIVTGSRTNKTAILNGLIIAGGNANGPRLGEKQDYDYQFRYGAGLYNDAGSPTLIDCIFTDNSAYMGGGGMYNANGSNPTLTNCIFDWNSAVDGCGIYNSNSNPILTDCLFNMNIAQNKGGGMYNEQSNPILTGCVFADNSGSYGAGIYNSQSNPSLTDCYFFANTTLTIRSTDSSVSCGGGMYNDQSSPILNNCIFAENSAYASLSNFGGAMYNNDNSNPILADCLFSANWSENYGGGIYNFESSPTFTDCEFNGNWAEEYGGGMYNELSNPTAINCMFLWNWAAFITSYHNSYPSGAGIYNELSNPILSACVISGNYAEGDGAGMYNSNSSPELANCIIAGNYTVDFGSAMYIQGGNLTLTNCTFFGNIAYEGNALGCDSPLQDSPSNIDMINCILWDGGNEIWNNDDSTIGITYSNIWGGFPGSGNIDTEPLFAYEGFWVDFNDPNIIVEPDDPNASWTAGDYHLKSQVGRWDPNSETWNWDDVTSACIDAGDPNSPVAFEPLPNGGIINMGAFGSTTEASKSPSELNSKYGGGTGEIDDPYLIYTIEHLNAISAEPNDWYKHFKLMADIDLAGYSYDQALIAPDIDTDEYYFQGTPFAGIFDGNGHTISNLTITGVSCLGLFGESACGAELKDLGVTDVNISGSGDFVGGLLGRNSWGAVVIQCYSTGTVDGDDDIGGLVGSNRGQITQCYSTSAASGDYIIGGLSGGNEMEGTLTNCYSTGAVNGNDALAGLLGFNRGEVIHCYCTGMVTGNKRLGSLVGWNYGTITSNFWDIQTSGLTNMCGSQEESASGCDDSSGLTTTEMQTVSMFLEAGWDLADETANGTDDIWWINEGQDYPRLWWELTK